jgi:hypothetical protein
MKERRDPTSPFGISLFFPGGEIDDICLKALKDNRCLPSEPGVVEIETFIEKQFGCAAEYEDLGAGVLGFTSFGTDGRVLRMGANSKLFEGGSSGARRARTTFAHEAGHGLLHALLFINPPRSELFPPGTFDASNRQIMCREEDLFEKRAYDGRWWEVQANQAIGGLLLPKGLVRTAAAPFLSPDGLGLLVLQDSKREEAARALAEIFEVNPAAVAVRLEQLWPKSSAQLTF